MCKTPINKAELITIIEGGGSLKHINTGNITDMSFLFYHNENFDEDISSWDVSNVEDFSYMFCGATKFNQNISSWDVSNARMTRFMFCTAIKFNQNLTNWSLTMVSDLTSMFDSASNFNGKIDKLVTGSANKISYMLSDTEFNQDISGWDVSNITEMKCLFKECRQFNQDISKWEIRNECNLYRMLYNCDNFKKDIRSMLLTDINIINNHKHKYIYNNPSVYEKIENIHSQNIINKLIYKGMNPMFYHDESHISVYQYQTSEKNKFVVKKSEWYDRYTIHPSKLNKWYPKLVKETKDEFEFKTIDGRKIESKKIKKKTIKKFRKETGVITNYKNLIIDSSGSVQNIDIDQIVERIYE